MDTAYLVGEQKYMIQEEQQETNDQIVRNLIV